MGRPVNWVLSGGAAAKCEVGRTLRLSLMATTIIAVVPVLGYGRPAYAACTEIGATAVYLGAPMSWVTVATAVVGALALWLLFGVLLQIPLPVGPLEAFL